MANPNPCVKTRFKQLEDKPLEGHISLRLKADLMSKVKEKGIPSRVARDAIAHALTCPLNSPEVAAGFDAIAASLQLSRSELIEQIGRGLLVVSRVESFPAMTAESPTNYSK